MGRYVKILEQIYISGWLANKFMEVYATIIFYRQFRYKRRNLLGLTSVRDASKTVFSSC
jgi:hypothetical protein